MTSLSAFHHRYASPGRPQHKQHDHPVRSGHASDRDISLIAEEASALTHHTIQRSFSFAALVYILWTCKTPIRYRGLESAHLLLSCSAYSSCDSSTVRAIRTPCSEHG